MKKNTTTKKIIFSILCLLVSISIYAQPVTLYTPNGSTIVANNNTEMLAQEITYYTDLYRNTYPQAEVLANASATYNCHSYAWNMSEGGNSCWLNQSPDLHKYWDDYSYLQTTESNAEKIFYYNGDHSAIKSKTVAGKFESKWGAMPLMRHAPDYGPSVYNMSYRKYYNKFTNFSISGPSQIICGQGSYSIDNLIGYTISWNSSPSSLINHPATGNPITVSKYGNGNVTLTGSVSTGHFLSKNIWVGPHTTINGINSILKDRTRTYTLNDVSGQGITSFHWSADGGVIPVGSTTSSSFTVKATGCDGGVISCIYNNSCGSGEAQLNIDVICETLAALTIFPNPASDIVNLNITDNTMTNEVNMINDDNSLDLVNYSLNTTKNQLTEPYTGEYEIQIWSEHSGLMKKNVENNKPSLQISTKSWPKGMYYVHLIVSGIIQQKQILLVK